MRSIEEWPHATRSAECGSRVRSVVPFSELWEDAAEAQFSLTGIIATPAEEARESELTRDIAADTLAVDSGGATRMTMAAADLLAFSSGRKFGTVLADPPWQFQNKTGKVAPEHRRLSRYGTLPLAEIMALPVGEISAPVAHLYLWVPNALLPLGLQVMEAWGFTYKSNIVWHKVRKDGGSDGRGVGFYFRNVTEMILFGVRGRNARTLAAGRRQVNVIESRKREHSRKPDEQYPIIESCSPGPYVELFARGTRAGWATWGNQADHSYRPTWATYAHHSQVGVTAGE